MFRIFLSAILFVAFSVSSLHAQWSGDPAINTPICPDDPHNHWQKSSPVSVSDGIGGVIIAWADQRSGNYDIYAQRVDACGNQWANNGVAICTATGDQTSPQIIGDGVGGAIIAWSGGGIYAQRVNASGTPQWTPNGIAICSAQQSQSSPRMVSDGVDGAILTWHDARNASTSNDIYAQRVSSNGGIVWTSYPNGVTICGATNIQLFPIIVTDNAQGAIIAWTDYRSAVGSSTNIYAQRVSGGGAVQWTSGGVAVCNNMSGQYQWREQMVADGAGGAILTWENGNPVNPDIYAQKIDASGLPVWAAGAGGVPVSTRSEPEVAPSVVSDGLNGAIVSWVTIQNAPSAIPGVYSQRLSATTGTKLWTATGVTVAAGGSFTIGTPRSISNGINGAIIAWDQSSNQIAAQCVNSAGVLQWTPSSISNGVLVSTRTGIAGTSLVSDNAQGFIVAFLSGTSPATGIYAQRVFGTGVLSVGLSGPYHIGSGRDFPTLTSALAQLNTVGLRGPTTFLLEDATYANETFPIVVNPICGATFTNRLTIKPAPGVTTTISSSTATSIFKLNGADYITIDGSNNGTDSRDLTISSTSLNSMGILVVAGSIGNTVRNCNISAGSTGVSSDDRFGYGTVTIENNLITASRIDQALIGIAVSGQAITIRRNTIGSATGSLRYGIYLFRTGSTTVSGNTIFHLNSADAIGIYGYSDLSNCMIENNNISDVGLAAGSSGNGIVVEGEASYPSSYITVVNNFISDIKGEGNAQVDLLGTVGIKLRNNVSNVKVYYNSVNLSGTISRPGATADKSAALYVGGTGISGVDVKNNIFCNSIVNTTGVATAYAIYGDASFSAIDNNNYFASGAQGMLGFMGSNRATIQQWQTATGEDLSSVTGDPGFTSSTDLHINPADPKCWVVNGQGIAGPASGSIAADIDGDTRSTITGTPTDIGADEFTPTVGPAAVRVPTSPGPSSHANAYVPSVFSVNGRTVAEIAWGPSGTPPDAMFCKYYPGVPPPDAGGSNIKSYWYIYPDSTVGLG